MQDEECLFDLTRLEGNNLDAAKNSIPYVNGVFYQLFEKTYQHRGVRESRKLDLSQEIRIREPDEHTELDKLRNEYREAIDQMMAADDGKKIVDDERYLITSDVNLGKFDERLKGVYISPKYISFILAEKNGRKPPKRPENVYKAVSILNNCFEEPLVEKKKEALNPGGGSINYLRIKPEVLEKEIKKRFDRLIPLDQKLEDQLESFLRSYPVDLSLYTKHEKLYYWTLAESVIWSARDKLDFICTSEKYQEIQKQLVEEFNKEFNKAYSANLTSGTYPQLNYESNDLNEIEELVMKSAAYVRIVEAIDRSSTKSELLSNVGVNIILPSQDGKLEDSGLEGEILRLLRESI